MSCNLTGRGTILISPPQGMSQILFLQCPRERTNIPQVGKIDKYTVYPLYMREEKEKEVITLLRLQREVERIEKVALFHPRFLLHSVMG